MKNEILKAIDDKISLLQALADKRKASPEQIHRIAGEIHEYAVIELQDLRHKINLVLEEPKIIALPYEAPKVHYMTTTLDRYTALLEKEKAYHQLTGTKFDTDADI